MVKKLCRNFALTRERKRRFCGMDVAEIRAAVGVGHVSSCERWLTVPRLGRFRRGVRHVLRNERCLTAIQNAECGAAEYKETAQHADC